MRRVIALQITLFDTFNLNTPLSEVSAQEFFRFNKKEINLLGGRKSAEYDAIHIFLTHPEFEEVEMGNVTPIFPLGVAKRRYPFMFFNTNPLLYRKFKL